MRCVVLCFYLVHKPSLALLRTATVGGTVVVSDLDTNIATDAYAHGDIAICRDTYYKI